MQLLLLATTNPGKVRELQVSLKDHFEVVSPKDERFKSIPVPKVAEDGDSYYEHAVKKAMAFYQAFRVPVLADDSGLEVEVLNGAPGVHSATLAGEKASWAERWEALYKMLRPFPSHTWQAKFRCVLCYYDGQGVPLFFQGTTEGTILPAPRGDGGFGYDPIFLSRSLQKSFAESTSQEKSAISHRAVAIQSFLAFRSS